MVSRTTVLPLSALITASSRHWKPPDALDCRWRLLPTQSASAAAAPSAPAAAAAAPADLAAVDAALEQLTGNKAAWAVLALGERITILKEIKARLTDKVGLCPAPGQAPPQPSTALSLSLCCLQSTPPSLPLACSCCHGPAPLRASAAHPRRRHSLKI
jgi:hypothetical protein